MYKVFHKSDKMVYYYTALLLLLPLVFTILFLTKLFTKSKLPPGPKPWPIIGNIHMLGDKPHQAVAELSKTYGPIMSLKLGSNTTIVISSPEVAKEMFLNHDMTVSSRTVPHAGRASNHDKFSMVWLPVCPKWRDLRKVATIQLFTNQRLDTSQDVRHKKVKELVEYVQQCSQKGLPVDIGKAAFTTVLNLLSNTFFSMDMASHTSSKSQEFKDLVWNLLEIGARPNLSDFFPLVKNLDLQGVLKITRVYMNKLMKIFDDIIDERLKDQTEVKYDVLDTLLKLVENNELSLDDVKHLLVDLFIAGTDTTSSTLEWTMTEILRNPETNIKAQIEVDKVLGKDESMQESDITKLPYIQAIVKETLRVHPPAPFLVPHKADKDVQLCNYLVPKNSNIWVNVWSIGRNPSVWPNPELFSPERFLDNDIGFKGRDFELIPFGTGRRMCPGMNLAYRMTHLMLATLLHSFSWEYGHGSSPKDIDMEEKFGITLQKVKPLLAFPFRR
ncbi:cytochrome P450 76AD1-like [Spinacia oleracea]|uniref:Cytochrome P450 76AD1-like n=1 Tax=Spinacia oleracea TaxID=3562 RepID=A0A9R0IVQ6_SPIOL|nr:cytochrome P450 76AD1-like [Spinacia oleracea]